MAEFLNTKQNLTDRDLDEFENKVGRLLPLSFKSHYRTYNGGSPAEEDVESGKWGLPVHGFNPIKYGNVTIETLIDDFGAINPKENSFGSWTKFSFVPFAYDAGAHPIFLSLRDQDYGSIYIYDPDGGVIVKISSSFEEFRAKLYKIRS
jgi:hypothetical protein